MSYDDVIPTGLYRYGAGQLECGEETAALHLQIYLVSAAGVHDTGAAAARKLAKVLSDYEATMIPEYGITVHGVAVTDTADSILRVKDYCHKEESRVPEAVVWAYGTLPTGKAGAKKTLESLRPLLAGGTTLGQLCVSGEVPLDMLSRHHTFLSKAQLFFQKKRHPLITPVGYMLVGGSGEGKTAWWMAKYGEDCYVMPIGNGGGQFWVTDEIIGKKVLIFDEFYGQIPMSLLLRIIDRQPLTLQTKGGMVQLQATEFVFTSNQEYTEWYPKVKLEHPEQWDAFQKAFKRRLDEWFTRPNFRLALREARLERRLTEQGGATVVLDGARVPRREVHESFSSPPR